MAKSSERRRNETVNRPHGGAGWNSFAAFHDFAAALSGAGPFTQQE
jgi:hypothetical protein